MTATEERLTSAETLGGALARVVALDGDRAAVRAEGREVTYSELQDRAAAIASLLGDQGLLGQAAPHVGILLDQGIDAIAAIVAVLQAGKAYVSLDSGDPADRLRWIAQDAELAVILTSPDHDALARDIYGDRVRVIDDHISGITRGAATSLPGASADDVAALVYTSGSTGKPKGVIQTHRNFVRYAADFGTRLELGPGDRLTLLYTLTFSAANTDIFGALLHGVTLCLYDTRRRGVEGLPAWIASEKITVLHTVPSVFRYLTEHVPSGGFDTVRAIDLGGEPVFTSDVRRRRSAFAEKTLLVNHYAATEISVIAQHVVTADDEVGDRQLPAGAPPSGVDMLVVDAQGRETRPGEVGEIVVRSAFLSPGYWGLPELSVAAFTADDKVPGRRRFRSGDAGRVYPDGSVVVLGRTDSRVKIRGHSIEPSEVEEALRGLAGVRDAVVEAQRTGSGADAEARLVGYVVPADAHGDASSARVVSPPDIGTLRRALAQRLPAHMLPAELHLVPAFPLTRTGKVDRAALAALPATETGVAEELHTAAEERVAAIYEGILGVPVRSRRDDFFMLGGTSMTLAQLQGALRREFGVELDLAEVMRSATVGDVAAHVDRRPATSAGLIVPLRPIGDRAPVFLIHGWHGQAFVTPAFLDAIPDGHPVYSIQARGLSDGERPLRSVREMARAYRAAISSVAGPATPVIAGVCAGGVIALEMAAQMRRATGEQPQVIMFDPPLPPYTRPLGKRMAEILTFYLALTPVRFGPVKKVTDRFVRRLDARANRIGLDAIDPARLSNDVAIRVAVSVGIALRRHRPSRYDGRVDLVASTAPQHIHALAGYQRSVSRQINRVVVAERHMDVLTPGNLAFQDAMKRLLGSSATVAE